MKKIIGFDFSLITRHPKTFLVLSLIFAFVFMAFNPFVKTVNNVDYFKLENDPDETFYENFKEVFGNDEFFVIAFEKENLFTASNLSLLQEITDDLEGIEEIEKVTSLANVDDVIGGEDYFEVRPFIAEIPQGAEALKSLKKSAVENPLYVKNLVSVDGRTAAIVVETFDRPEDGDYRKRLIEKTQDILSKYKTRVDRFYLGGWTTTNLSLGTYLKKDVAIFIPATYLLITLTIWFFFRNITLTLLAVLNITVCVGATRGFMGLTGITLNNVTTIAIPLVMALALCDTVHIFSHMNKRILNKLPDRADALAHVLRQVALPCFLTTLTTAAGFLSLAVSDIPPIRQFAWVASSGMVFEFIFSFFFLPPLILFFRPEKIYREYGTKDRVTRMLEGLTGFVKRHHRRVVVATCAVVAASLWYASGLRVETNLLEFFKKKSSVRTSLDFVENRISGVSTLDVSLLGDDEDAFKYPLNLKVIERVQQHIDSIEQVDKTLSFVDFLKEINQSFHNEDKAYYSLPESKEMVSQYLLIYDSDEIEDFISPDYSRARISVRMSEHSSGGLAIIVQMIDDFLATMETPGIETRITGWAIRDINTIDALVNGQVYSLTIAAVVISLIMFLVFRSVSIAFLSMLPNFFPIVLNFGIMGMVGIALNTGTALIAAVALGIAVDDTIHFLSEYQQNRNRNMPVSTSIESAIRVKGRAIVSSSIILCIGFGVMVLSRFVPTIHFGMLSAIIMITALLGDLVVLPAFLFLKKESAIGPEMGKC